MSEFFEVLEARRSVRHYADGDVEDRQLDAILDAMRRAPSAGDLQAYEVVVVRSPERRRRLANAAQDQEFVADAPVVLAFFMDPERSRGTYGERGASLYACQDATLAAAHAQLAAHALGLATVWVGAFDDEAVRGILSAPASLQPSSLLVIGHAGESPGPTPRRSMAELVHHESFASAD